MTRMWRRMGYPLAVDGYSSSGNISRGSGFAQRDPRSATCNRASGHSARDNAERKDRPGPMSAHNTTD
ncbi:MAG: hypothetical protein P8K80_09180 [Phycisphaerales bacterium]|nr:hypothetical protein [Phycisphaerales bacterium]